MIEADYTLEVAVSASRVWRYVEVIPNWAPFLVGFQKLELVDDRRSMWTLRGDVGALARQVRIQADITHWEPPRRAEFTITGITERITGSGRFELAPATESAPAPAPGKASWWRRLRFALARLVLRRLGGAPGRPVAQTDDHAGERDGGHASERDGGRSRLRFQLQIAPGGPMAPMVELLMRPMVEPAAQDFLQAIRRELEQGAGTGRGTGRGTGW